MIRFLTAEEVAELTGFVRPAAQKRWLSENDFSFVEGGDGRPKVLEEVVLSRLGARHAKKEKGPRLRLTGQEIEMRPRKKDRHLPMCMFQRGPSFYFVRDGKWTNLGRDYRAALLEYAKLTGGASKDGMIDLIDRVMDHIAPYRSANTITQYRAVAERLKDMFAEFQPREVLPKHVAQVKTHMASTPNMANRTLTVLRVVFAQALEWGEVDSNPCIGIKPHSEKKRGRYLNDKELLSILDNCSEYMRCIFELAYLTGQRIGDVLSIKLDDVSDDGIAFQQQKTGSKVLISMTPDLDAVVQRAKALPRPADAKNLICNRKGKQVDYATTRDAWRRAREAAGVTDARIHDLRAKALTDAKKQGKDARKLGGHTDPRMTDRYIRQREHEVAEPPTMPRKSGQYWRNFNTPKRAPSRRAVNH